MPHSQPSTKNSQSEDNGGGRRPHATCRYARNAEQLARAFFPKKELTPRKRRRTIELVSEWLAAADFPKKNPPSKGWVIAEVEQWLNLKAEGRGRRAEKGEHRTSNIEHRTSKETGSVETEVSTAENGASRQQRPTDGEENELPFGDNPDAAKRVRLSNQYKKWLEAKSTVRDERDLLAAGLITREQMRAEAVDDEQRKAEVAEPSSAVTDRTLHSPLPDCESQKALAVRLAQHFRGRMTIDISEQQISKWKAGDGLPPGAMLPPPKLGNRFDTQAWADWVERFIAPRYGVRTDPQGRLEPSIFDRANEAEAQRKIDEAEKVRIDLEITRGKYIEVAAAERLVAGLARRYHEAWKARVERDDISALRAKCLSLGVEPEIVERICEWSVERARDLVALVETQCEAAALEAGKMLTAESA